MRAGSFEVLSCLVTHSSMPHLLAAFLRDQCPKDHCQGKKARMVGVPEKTLRLMIPKEPFEYIFNRSIRLNDWGFEIFRP